MHSMINPRIYTIASILMICVLVLTGCKPNALPPVETPFISTTESVPPPEKSITQLPPTPTIAPVSTIAVKEEELDGIKISLLHPLGDYASQGMEELAKEFNTSNPWGIILEVQAAPSYNDLLQQMTNALETGHTPHIVMASTDQLSAWNQQNVLIDINGYIADPIWGLSADQIMDYYPVFWEQDKIGDRRLGFPIIRTAEVIAYNRTWAHELGFQDPPLTPEDFEKQACTAAAKNAGSEYLGFYGTGGWFMDTDPHIALSWLDAFGAKEIFDSNSKSYTFSTPEVENAFTFLRQLAENLCAWNNEVPRPEESTEPYLYFPTHQVLLASLSVDELPYLAAAMAKAGNTDDWVFLPYPTEDGAGSMLTYGYSLGMFVASPAEQLASWLVIQWFAETGQVASLASMTDTLPVRISSVEEMNISSQAEQAIALLGLAATPPVDPSWRLVQPVLRDAMWENMVQFQLIHTIPNVSVRTVDELLAEMDETAAMLTGE